MGAHQNSQRKIVCLDDREVLTPPIPWRRRLRSAQKRRAEWEKEIAECRAMALDNPLRQARFLNRITRYYLHALWNDRTAFILLHVLASRSIGAGKADITCTVRQIEESQQEWAGVGFSGREIQNCVKKLEALGMLTRQLNEGSSFGNTYILNEFWYPSEEFLQVKLSREIKDKTPDELTRVAIGIDQSGEPACGGCAVLIIPSRTRVHPI